MKKTLLILLFIPFCLLSQNGPTASFIYNPVCLGSNTVFTDFSSADPNSSSQIVSWNWQYNGNTFSSQQNTDYLFSQCGNYDIILTVTDNNGVSDDTTISIEIFCPPTAGFVCDAVCLGEPSNFIDISTPGDGSLSLNSGSSWMYVFGDATPPNAVNPNSTTTFNSAGTKSVMLIVSELQFNGLFCVDTLVQNVQVDSCFVGIENHGNLETKKIINNYSILGKTKKTKSREINIVIYDDGTVEKKIIIE